jgi:sulfatase maturation enzyme AslB (radical SAM superfamily)
MKIGTNIALVFPILICNQKCPYCVNHHSGETKLRYNIEPGAKWIAGINSLELIDEIRTGGGEPTLHPDFVDIFNNIKNVPYRILIGTNGAQLAVDKLVKVKPRPELQIQISFHPTQTKQQEFIERILIIRDVHGKNVGVHMISRDGQIDAETALNFKNREIHITGDTFLYDHEGFYQERLRDFSDMTKPPRRIRCPLSIYKPIAPNGDIYACHQLMYTQSKIGILGNIFSGWSVNALEVDCPMYGWCNPCDDGHFQKRDQLRTLQHKRPELAEF